MAGKKKRGRNRSKQGKRGRPNAPVPVRGYDTAIERAQHALEQNRAKDALNLAETGLTFINPARNTQAAGMINQIMAEAHFRLGVEAANPNEQVRHLNMALKLDPKDTRFHFHQAVTHFRQGRPAEVDAALAKAGDHPGVAYVRSLNQLVAGKPWTESGLTGEEVNTLRLLQALRKKQPLATLDKLTEQPLLGPNELWQALIAQRSNPSAVPSGQFVEWAKAFPSIQAQNILHYYAGIAALDQGESKEAGRLWAFCAQNQLNSLWFRENLDYLSREHMVAAAQAGNWQEIVDRADQHIGGTIDDRILAETVGTAYFTLGYQAAEAGKWQKAAELLRKANNFMGGRTLSQNLALCEEALENWRAAGDAWRDMARRRPRSEKRPDYMSDAQVAALWAHAADCYRRDQHDAYDAYDPFGGYDDYDDAEGNDEVISCLRTAVKYAENDVVLRTKLANALIQADRFEAAENELYRILEIDDKHVPALLSLAHMTAESWGGDAGSLFRRALAIDPANQEARDGLADYHLKQVQIMRQSWNFFARVRNRETNEVLNYLKRALADLPGNSALLMELAVEYRQLDKREEAIAALVQAYQSDPKDVGTTALAMHELLHLDANAELESIVAEVRELPTLLAPFWVSQGDQALECGLDDDWTLRFFDEALLLAEKGRGEDSRAHTLLQILDVTIDHEDEYLTENFLAMVKDEMPKSGILEYAEARAGLEQKIDKAKIQRLLRKASQLAAKSGDKGVIKQIEDAQSILSGRFNPIMDILRDMGGDLEGLEDLDEDMLDDLFNDFRRTFGGPDRF